METNLQMLYKQGVDMNLNHTYSIKIWQETCFNHQNLQLILSGKPNISDPKTIYIKKASPPKFTVLIRNFSLSQPNTNHRLALLHNAGI